ncbi:PAS domain S-box-containing protein [Fontibacillus phaseoli]|uniref:histidine kinase n=1 Tax=Fontibacillus phaseoli TaxID=1416533 RepID=A0A369AYD3_9BACL|nr:PAS domain S-box protein [Fontibacillus phaseoli]RCX14442.1 PAS domain S-box-containing protein [Fontibacillus phaseoli]
MNNFIFGFLILIFLLALYTVIAWFRKRIGQYRKALDEADQRISLLENMLHNIDVGTWSYNDQSRSVVFTSRAFITITGYSPDNFNSKMAWENIVHPDDIHHFRTVAAGLRRGEADTSEYRIIHVNREIRWVEVRIIPTLDESGNLARLDGMVLDITGKRKAEQELQESEERFSRLIEISPHPMIVQKDERFVYVNPAGLRLMGVDTLEEIVGQEIYRILPPHEWNKARNRVSFIAENEFGAALEYEVIGRHGQVVNAEVIGIYDAHMETTVHVFYDITERKKIEVALKETMERYRRLVELSPVAIALCHKGMIVYVNPAGMRILGARDLADIIGTTPWDWVIEEDVEWCRALFADLMEAGSLPPKEMALVRVNGEKFDAVVIGIFDNTNSTVEIVFEDITSRKQAERALLASEEFNRQLVELSPIAILLHRDKKFTYANPASVALYGAKDKSEIIGLAYWDILGQEIYEEVMTCETELDPEFGSTPMTQHKVVCLNGNVIEVEAITTPLPHLGQGAAMTLAWDITSRKKAEKERWNAEQLIRQSEDRYFRLQISLDQFSSDLFGVVKVDELNSRLVREVRQVLGTGKISLMKAGPDGLTVVTHGGKDIPDDVLLSIREHGADRLPICRLIDTLDGHYVKIGEVNGESRILCVGESSPLLLVQAQKVWLETLSRYVSVLYDNFRVIEDLKRDIDMLASGRIMPQWLLRFIFHLSENERKRLSQDLHDAALQEQIVWYRKLNQITADPELPSQYRCQLSEIEQGLLDVIYQIRITCNELRPPLLKEEGLERSLETLFEFAQLRTNYAIQFDYSNLGLVIHDDIIIGLYRIVQEMLANATKHSDASLVTIKLYSGGDHIYLHYEDNGVGMDVGETTHTFNSMGIYGMKERVRSMDGHIEFSSSSEEGLSITISIPAR